MVRATLRAAVLVIGLSLIVTPLFAGEDADEAATPKVLCFAFVKDGDANSAKLEGAFLAKMRTAYAAKNVLFVKADLSSTASTHQARLLVNALGYTEVWSSYSKQIGTVVLVDGEWGNVAATLNAKSSEADAKAAFEKALKPAEDGE